MTILLSNAAIETAETVMYLDIRFTYAFLLYLLLSQVNIISFSMNWYRTQNTKPLSRTQLLYISRMHQQIYIYYTFISVKKIRERKELFTN